MLLTNLYPPLLASLSRIALALMHAPSQKAAPRWTLTSSHTRRKLRHGQRKTPFPPVLPHHLRFRNFLLLSPFTQFKRSLPARKFNSRSTSRTMTKDGYSPEMRLIQDSLHIHIHPRQLAHGPSRWKRQKRLMDTATLLWHHAPNDLDIWRKRRLKLFPTSDDHINILQLRGVALASMSGPPTHIDPPSLLDSILYSSMRPEHSSTAESVSSSTGCTEDSFLTSKRVAHMQEVLELNNIRAVFQRIGLKPQQRLDLSYLQRSDDTIIANPIEIHEAHKDHFDTHHSFPASLDPSTQAFSTVHSASIP